MPLRCKVTIEGIGRGILFNNPAKMLKESGDRGVGPKTYIPEQEAHESCYWNKGQTEIGIPGDMIKASLIKAASGLKVPGKKKLSLTPIIAGDVQIVENWIGLGTKEYEMDIRPVVIQRQRIPRVRAWLPNWSVQFTVEWETSLLGTDFHLNALPELLTISGERIGIGDFRPSCKGPFGKYRTVCIELLNPKTGKPETKK